MAQSKEQNKSLELNLKKGKSINYLKRIQNHLIEGVQ